MNQYTNIAANIFGLLLAMAPPFAWSQSATTMAGSILGEFSVAASGAAVYRIPIRVNPGVAGMTPKLELTYSSQNGNGVMGLGWTLSGLSSVRLCPSTLASHGVRRGIKYDGADKLCLDGEKLILVTAGPSGVEYRTESDKFSFINFKDNAFTVKTKAGLTLEYGNGNSIRPNAVIEAQGKSVVREWALSAIRDVAGNYQAFSYIEDNVNGDYRINEINYGGNYTHTPIGNIKFEYESRLDAPQQWLAGSSSSSQLRLKKIVVRGVIEYRLNYKSQESRLDASKLTSVTECATGGVCLRPLNVTWPLSALGEYSQTIASVPTNNWDASRTWSGDFNGDGRSDLVSYAAGNLVTFFGNGFGQVVSAVRTDNWDASRVWGGDFNGDGLSDLASYAAGNLVTFLSKGNGNFEQKIAPVPTNNWDASRVWSGDFNGDGRTDLLSYYSGNLITFLSTGNGTYEQKIAAVPPSAIVASQVLIGDSNGDGQSDLVSYSSDSIYTHYSNGDGTYSQSSFSALPIWIRTAVWSGDFNGDGLLDFVSHEVLQPWNSPPSNRALLVSYFSKGDGQYDRSSQTILRSEWDHTRVWTGDFNADGKTDLLSYSQGKLITRFSAGTGGFTYEARDVPQSNWDANRAWGGDFNGDGRSDLLSYWNGTIVTFTPYGRFNPYVTDPYVSDRYATQFSVGDHVIAWIDYKPLTFNKYPALYAKDTSTAVYPRMDVRPPMYVVSSVSKNNGVGGYNTTAYRYWGLKVELGTGRGVLGFKGVTSHELATGLVNYTEFNQDFPFIGMAMKNETNLYAEKLSEYTSSPPRLTKRTTVVPGCKNPNDGTACVVRPGARYFPYVVSSKEESWDLNGTAYPALNTLTEYGLDEQGLFFGDPTQITTTIEGGGSKTTLNVYYPADTINWILGRLKRATVTSTTP